MANQYNLPIIITNLQLKVKQKRCEHANTPAKKIKQQINIKKRQIELKPEHKLDMIFGSLMKTMTFAYVQIITTALFFIDLKQGLPTAVP